MANASLLGRCLFKKKYLCFGLTFRYQFYHPNFHDINAEFCDFVGYSSNLKTLNCPFSGDYIVGLLVANRYQRYVLRLVLTSLRMCWLMYSRSYTPFDSCSILFVLPEIVYGLLASKIFILLSVHFTSRSYPEEMNEWIHLLFTQMCVNNRVEWIFRLV